MVTATPATLNVVVVVVEMRDCETPGSETERYSLARLSSPRIFISRRTLLRPSVCMYVPRYYPRAPLYTLELLGRENANAK